ncbi:hypothetical protein D3C73_1645240 [compost metagenome]
MATMLTATAPMTINADTATVIYGLSTITANALTGFEIPVAAAIIAPIVRTKPYAITIGRK